MKFPPTPRLARFLRECRIRAGMSLQYVADATNEHPLQLTKAALQRIETDQSPVHSVCLQVLANIYCVDPALLLEVLDLDLYAPPGPKTDDVEQLWDDGSEAVREGKYRAAIAAFDRMLEIAEDSEQKSKAAVGLSTALFRIGSYRLSAFYAEVPLKAGAASPGLQAHALYARAKLEQQRHLLVSAEWLSRGAAEVARSAGDERLALDADVLLAATAHSRGDFAQAIERYGSAADSLQALGAQEDASVVRVGLALSKVRAGETATGLDLHAFMASATKDNPSTHCYAKLAWGESLYRLGRMPEAVKQLRAAVHIARKTEDREFLWLAQYYLWRITGDPQTLGILRSLRERLSDHTYHPEIEDFDREQS